MTWLLYDYLIIKNTLSQDHMNKVYKIRTASTPCSALLLRTSLGSTDDAIIVRSQDRIKRCQNSFWREEDRHLKPIRRFIFSFVNSVRPSGHFSSCLLITSSSINTLSRVVALTRQLITPPTLLTKFKLNLYVRSYLQM